jgi:dienelactone hydrolase
VEFRSVVIFSEGARLAGEVFLAKNAPAGKRPTIVMSHGWGGNAALLRPDAVVFARAGFLVVTFDYRGWGASEGRVILTQPAPADRKGTTFAAEVREIREVVDPLDQVNDLLNVLHWAQGEERIDQDRIGLWGSSYSGGHVVYAAAHDPRVKALVSQVGSLDSRFVIADAVQRAITYKEATERARGEIGYPPPGARVIGNLRGAPIREKLMHYAPVEDADKAPTCAMLFLTAEKEELFANKDHAGKAFERAKGPKKLIVLPGIRHYGVYLEARKKAQELALEWFKTHLADKAADAPAATK